MSNNVIFNWNEEKNLLIKETRGISFEDAIAAIERDDFEIIPNRSRNHRGQRCFIVNINNYPYLVPFIENEGEVFLKTVYPSRKHKKS